MRKEREENVTRTIVILYSFLINITVNIATVETG